MTKGTADGRLGLPRHSLLALRHYGIEWDRAQTGGLHKDDWRNCLEPMKAAR